MLCMFLAGRVISAALALCLAAGCAPKTASVPAAAESTGVSSRWAGTGDPGLEVIAWSTEADPGTFARALAPWAQPGNAPGGLSPESLAFLASHGLYLLEVPVTELESLRVAIGAPPRHVNQWLGQALVWTEVVSGPEQSRGQTIALEAGRLRLGPGRLRLLARSWIVPVPTNTAPGGGALTIELLPQHDEEGRARSRDSLLAPTSIAATEEGMLFTRLMVRMSARSSDTAFVLVGLPPGTDIQRLAQSAPETTDLRAITDGEAGAVPSVGQVVRQPPGSASPSVAYETSGSEPEPAGVSIGPVGPPAARLPTLGEAMLSPPVWVTPRRNTGRAGAAAEEDVRPVQTTPRRMVTVFVPRLPERVQLLP